MTLEQIYEQWEADSKIDSSALDTESLRIPLLHSKYYKMFSTERLKLKKLEADMKKLKLEKHEFLTQGPTEEQHKAGWELPARGMIIKNEVEKYLDADDDIITMSMKLAYQREKVELLTSIIDSLNRRSFSIKNAIDFIRWSHGG